MQAIAIACSVLFAIVDFTQAQDDISNSLYTTRYERLNVDTILQSPRLVTNYVECLLNKKPCAPEGKALKRILPEALRTKCSRCHPSQKEVALKVITALYFDYPQHYKALREKWDPSGEYNKRFEEYLRDQKFNSIGGGEADQGEQAQGSSFSINVTQRPTRQGQVSNKTQPQGQQPSQTPPPPPPDTKPSATESDDKDLPAILNRFGGDDEDGYDYTAPKPANETVVQATTVAPQQPARPQKPSAPAQPQPQQPQRPQQQQPSAPAATSAPSRRPSNGNNSPSSGGSAKPSHNNNNSPGGSHTWTHHNNHPAPSLSTTYYLQTQNPVLNIINRITLKFANTAEFIAGMLRGAVPQPQAPTQTDEIFRKFCDRLRKTILSYTNYKQNDKKYHHSFY